MERSTFLPAYPLYDYSLLDAVAAAVGLPSAIAGNCIYCAPGADDDSEGRFSVTCNRWSEGIIYDIPATQAVAGQGTSLP
jgi:hypothetical protein